MIDNTGPITKIKSVREFIFDDGLQSVEAVLYNNGNLDISMTDGRENIFFWFDLTQKEHLDGLRKLSGILREMEDSYAQG